MNTPICDFLENYANSGTLRLHMPGHKGEFPHDITEIYGADSLYETEGGSGVIACSERLASYLYGAERTYYSCGGSTLAIQAALAVLKANGCKKIAASRYSHRSLVSAAAMLRLDIKWLYPKEYLSADISGDIASAKGADALFITNIDYYGGTCRVAPQKMPTVVDNAHGAYLKFVDKDRFGTEYIHPMELDYPVICADSAHKTLPVLTGGAYLHFAKGTKYARAKEFMAAFGSSSPSYLVLESLDRFNKTISDDMSLVNRACESVAMLKQRLSALGVPMKKSDPLRIVIDARASGYTGQDYAAKLRVSGTECEMADDNYVVLLFSAATTFEDCRRAEIAVAFVQLTKPLPKKEFPVLKPHAELPVYEALFRPQKSVSVDKAVGEVCGGLNAPCPPCVPIIMPGERIDKAAAEALKLYGVKKIQVLTRT